MKVYVNKFPKSCRECFACYEYDWCEINKNLDVSGYGANKSIKQRHPDCPLHSLADHDKKVRADVVAENQALKARWEKLKEYITQGIENDYNGCAYIYPDGLKKMQEILEKMQELEKE